MRHSPEDSEKARPNFAPGTVPTRISYRSSTVLMKWLWPKIMLAPSGMISFTTFNSMTHLAAPDGKSGKPFRSGDFCGIISLLRARDNIKKGEMGKRGIGERVSAHRHLPPASFSFPFFFIALRP
jgi:hypothetical protein